MRKWKTCFHQAPNRETRMASFRKKKKKKRQLKIQGSSVNLFGIHCQRKINFAQILPEHLIKALPGLRGFEGRQKKPVQPPDPVWAPCTSPPHRPPRLCPPWPTCCAEPDPPLRSKSQIPQIPSCSTGHWRGLQRQAPQRPGPHWCERRATPRCFNGPL